MSEVTEKLLQAIDDAKHIIMILEANGITPAQFSTSLPFLVASEFIDDESTERYEAFLQATDAVIRVMRERRTNVR